MAAVVVAAVAVVDRAVRSAGKSRFDRVMTGAAKDAAPVFCVVDEFSDQGLRLERLCL